LGDDAAAGLVETTPRTRVEPNALRIFLDHLLTVADTVDAVIHGRY
jgi:hypothetical protein